MKHREFHIGPGAASLMLVIVAVSMSMLGLLSLMNAQGDYRLFQRSSEFTQAEYQASAAAEKRLAALDAILAECAASAADHDAYLALVAEKLDAAMTVDGNTVSWTEESPGGRTLWCAVDILPLGSAERYSWREHLFMAGGDEIF